jgi:hypothetical protein
MGLGIFCIGLIVGFIISQFLQTLKVYRENEYVLKAFYSLLDKIEAGETKFLSRVNEHVSIFINSGAYAGHVILVNINDRSIIVSKNAKVVLQSEFIRLNFPNDKIIDDIMNEIEYRFRDLINDIVDVNGTKVDRKFMDETMKQHKSGGYGDSNIPPPKPHVMSVDDVLDKILKDGFGSLTDEEKQILQDKSNDR